MHRLLALPAGYLAAVTARVFLGWVILPLRWVDSASRGGSLVGILLGGAAATAGGVVLALMWRSGDSRRVFGRPAEWSVSPVMFLGMGTALGCVLFFLQCLTSVQGLASVLDSGIADQATFAGWTLVGNGFATFLGACLGAYALRERVGR